MKIKHKYPNKFSVPSKITIKNKTENPYGTLQKDNKRFCLKKAKTVYYLLDERKITIEDTFHKNGRATIKQTWEGNF